MLEPKYTSVESLNKTNTWVMGLKKAIDKMIDDQFKSDSKERKNELQIRIEIFQESYEFHNKFLERECFTEEELLEQLPFITKINI